LYVSYLCETKTEFNSLRASGSFPACYTSITQQWASFPAARPYSRKLQTQTKEHIPNTTARSHTASPPAAKANNPIGPLETGLLRSPPRRALAVGLDLAVLLQVIKKATNIEKRVKYLKSFPSVDSNGL
jgi:hypothetical protein